jgi:Zn-dependent protease
MSTSILYHAFNLKGITYKATRYEGDAMVFFADIRRDFIRCPKCGCRHFTFKGQKTRKLHMSPIGRKMCILALALHRTKCEACATLWWPSLPFMLGATLPAWLVTAGVVVIGLNLFNLLPVEPLDGGVALRSVLAKLMGTHARFGLLTIGLALLASGFYFEQVILLIFGGISVLANLRPRLIDHGLKPLSSPGVVISAFAFVTTVAAYSVMLAFFLGAFR